jgi:nucleoside-diphosphate-sugar epimerase
MKRNKYIVIGHWNEREPYELSDCEQTIEWRRANLMKEDEICRLLEDVDIIIQAAAVTSGSKDIIESPHVHICKNAVMNSLLLAEAYKRKVKKFVFMSCSVMYKSGVGPQKEDQVDVDAIDRRYFGAAHTKMYIEKIMEFYSMSGEMTCIAIRHSNIYGPHDKYDEFKSHFFGATVRKIMSNAGGELLVWGDGSEKKDLLYVEDLVRFVESVLCQESSRFEVVNCGSEAAVPIADIVKEMLALSGNEFTIRYDKDMPHIPASIEMCCKKARMMYHWTPKVGIREGIIRTLKWYEETCYR